MKTKYYNNLYETEYLKALREAEDRHTDNMILLCFVKLIALMMITAFLVIRFFGQ